MKVYVFKPSGNSYKVRILLGLLGTPHELVYLDPKKHEHRAPEFMKINPRGEVPAIDDNGLVLWDSAACLTYIARKHGGDQWLPVEAGAMAQVMQWVSLAATEIQCGLQYGRRGVLNGRWTLGELELANAFGRVALDIMEARLKQNDWLALGRPTIADIACFPYVETAPQGKQPLDAYPAIRAWLERCRALPGWPKREA